MTGPRSSPLDLPRFTDRVADAPLATAYLMAHGGGSSDGWAIISGMQTVAYLAAIGGGDSEAAAEITMYVKPIVTANGPYEVIEGSAVLLSRAGSKDLYGPADYYWLPGDGRDGGAEYGPWTDEAGDQSFDYDTPGVFQARVRAVSQTTGLENVAYATVTVTSLATVSYVVITPDVVNTSTGQVVTLWAAAYDAADQPVPGLPISWETTDGAVTELQSTTGEHVNVTAGDAGEATVTATCAGVESAGVVFTVSAVSPVYQIVVTPGSVSGTVGSGLQLEATVTD